MRRSVFSLFLCDVDPRHVFLEYSAGAMFSLNVLFIACYQPKSVTATFYGRGRGRRSMWPSYGTQW